MRLLHFSLNLLSFDILVSVIVVVCVDSLCNNYIMNSRLLWGDILVEFLQKFTSNNGFQLFLDVLLNFAPQKDRPDWAGI